MYMDDHHNGFDQSAEPVGPEIDDSTNPTDTSPDPSDKPRPAGREMLAQLQNMIDTASYQASPTLRQIGAKAAELAALAGAKAGPLAYKAAEATDQFGQRVAARSKSVAADLRRVNDDAAVADGSAEADGSADGAEATSSESHDSDADSGESTSGQ